MQKKTKLGILGLIVIAAALGSLYGLFKGERGHAQVLTARQSLNRKLVFNIKTGQLVNRNEAYAAGAPWISWRHVEHKWRGGRSSWLGRRDYDYVVSLSVANMDMEFAPTKDDGSLLRDYWNDSDDGSWPEVPERKTSFYVWTVGPDKFNHPILFRTFDGTTGMLKIVRVERPNEIYIRYKYVNSTTPALGATSEMDRRFAVTLPSGGKIEVVGISRCPSAGQAWWKPNGQILERAPYINKRKAFKSSREG
ncbi:MAG: hypothetical protein ACYTBJ_19565, partial [Planctomycetota bacterium]